MKCLERNKQLMKYAQMDSTYPLYDRDEEGNIIYDNIDGFDVPRETGEYETGYGEPVEFRANISSKLHEIIIEAFGADNSSNYAQLVCEKGQLPLKVGSAIWRTRPVQYKKGYDATSNEEITYVDGSTADYVVRGVLDEGLESDMYFLRKLN